MIPDYALLKDQLRPSGRPAGAHQASGVLHQAVVAGRGAFGSTGPIPAVHCCREPPVMPQVKSGAYRLDMVVEGENDTRLAIECDGDEFHGADPC